jgi:hypothetical protein
LRGIGTGSTAIIIEPVTSQPLTVAAKFIV